MQPWTPSISSERSLAAETLSAIRLETTPLPPCSTPTTTTQPTTTLTTMLPVFLMPTLSSLDEFEWEEAYLTTFLTQGAPPQRPPTNRETEAPFTSQGQ